MSVPLVSSPSVALQKYFGNSIYIVNSENRVKEAIEEILFNKDKMKKQLYDLAIYTQEKFSYKKWLAFILDKIS